MKIRLLLPGILLVAFSSTIQAQVFPPFDILRGDANNDSQVNISDSIAINNWLYQGGNTPPCLDAADVNDDGSINIADVIYLNYFLYLGGSPPPPPYPQCGQDPSQDSLTCLSSACE